MAQHDYIVANQSGAAFRADLNNALAAIVSQNSGAAAPSTTYSYMPWIDTTAGVFKIRNAANNGWTSLYQLDGEWSNITLENGTAAEPSLAFKSGAGLFSPGTNRFAVETSGTQRLEIDASGRLLVGVSSSSANASAVFQGSSGGGAAAQLWLSNTGSSPADGEALGTQEFSDNGHIAAARIVARRDGGTWTSGSSHPTRLELVTTPNGSTAPVVRVTVADNGSVGIGSTNAARALTVRTSTLVDTAAFEHGSSSMTGACVVTSTARSAGTTAYFVYGIANNVATLAITNNGDVRNQNNVYGSISDIKLKDNIIDAASQWSDIKALKVRKYNFTQGQTHTQIGLIAQEVELVSPGLVSESPDRDAEGNDLGTVTKSVNYSVLYMKAVKALQEAMERIEALEATVAAL